MLDLSRFVIIKVCCYGESEQPILHSINILNFVSKYFKQRPHHLNLENECFQLFSVLFLLKIIGLLRSCVKPSNQINV